MRSYVFARPVQGRNRCGKGPAVSGREEPLLYLGVTDMFEFGFKSDTGKMRKNNQDSFFVLPDKGVFLVADGVGGHSHGEIASRTVMADIADYINDRPIDPDADADGIKDYFVDLVYNVNEHIFRMAEGRSARNMATTLIILYIHAGKAYVANVGDSRLYLIREDMIRQVTEDHTYVNDLIKKGIIDREQAKGHPDRNLITRAIGAEQKVRPDLYMFDVYDEDILLLCTDGLYDMIMDDEIKGIVLGTDNMRSACINLVDRANEEGGADNITAVTVKIQTGGRSQ